MTAKTDLQIAIERMTHFVNKHEANINNREFFGDLTIILMSAKSNTQPNPTEQKPITTPTTLVEVAQPFPVHARIMNELRRQVESNRNFKNDVLYDSNSYHFYRGRQIQAERTIEIIEEFEAAPIPTPTSSTVGIKELIEQLTSSLVAILEQRINDLTNDMGATFCPMRSHRIQELRRTIDIIKGNQLS